MSKFLDLKDENKVEEAQEEGEEEEEPEYAGIKASWLFKKITKLSKNAILDALPKHKAAVLNQSVYRGYKIRQEIARLHKAAVKIQQTWRGFLGRKRYYRILETTLKKRLIEYYQRNATIIQSTFRGFYSRKYVHDQNALNKLQLQASRELLQCVAVKMRELLKNQQIPGIYSLRNSKCLSKVEKLLATLQVKKYNLQAQKNRTAEVHKLTQAFEKCKKSQEKTDLPFGTCERTARETPRTK